MNTYIHVIDDVAQVESLIKSGVNINEKEEESGFAPLHYSAGAGKLLFIYFFINSETL